MLIIHIDSKNNMHGGFYQIDTDVTLSILVGNCNASIFTLFEVLKNLDAKGAHFPTISSM